MTSKLEAVLEYSCDGDLCNRSINGKRYYCRSCVHREIFFPTSSRLPSRDFCKSCVSKHRRQYPEHCLVSCRAPGISPVRMESFAHSMRVSFSLHRERPAIVELLGHDDDCTEPRAYEFSYAELVAGIVMIQEHLKMYTLPGDRIGIVGNNSSAFLMSLAACMCSQRVAVPISNSNSNNLSGSAKAASVCYILATDEFSRDQAAMAVSVENVGVHFVNLTSSLRGTKADKMMDNFLKTMEEYEGGVSTPNELRAILLSSGSTGSSKGVEYTDGALKIRALESRHRYGGVVLLNSPMPYATAFFAGLLGLASGGLVCLYSPEAALGIMEAAQRIHPTSLSMPPRVWGRLHTQYHRDLCGMLGISADSNSVELQRALREAGPNGRDLVDSLRARYGTLFGRRCRHITTGGGPTSKAILSWMHECFKEFFVYDSYGSTECGRIAENGVLFPSVKIRLEPVPELGMLGPKDGTGLLWVQSRGSATRYLRAEDSATLIASGEQVGDHDGGEYICTGDLVRLTGRRIELIGRKSHSVKMAQAEFVSPEQLEVLYLTCPLIDQLYIHVEDENSEFLLAVARLASSSEQVYDPSELLLTSEQQVLLAFSKLAESEGLRGFELPRAILLVEPGDVWTSANGLLTETQKPCRRNLASKYAAWLSLAAANVRQEVSALKSESVVESKHRLVAQYLNSAKFIDLDSVQTMKLRTRVQKDLGVLVNPHLLRSHAEWTVENVSELVSHPLVSPEYAFAELLIEHSPNPPSEKEIQIRIRRATDAKKRTVLLTGVTGFLGRELLYALLDSGCRNIFCLVRDIRVGIESRETWLRDRGMDGIEFVQGDLSQSSLGLDCVTWHRIAKLVDLVVHCGAHVSSVHSLDSLYLANVASAAELARFGVPVAYISSMSVFSGSIASGGTIEEGDTPVGEIPPAAGYAASKRMAEIAFMRALEGQHIPSLWVARPATIGPAEFLTKPPGEAEQSKLSSHRLYWKDTLSRFVMDCMVKQRVPALPGRVLDWYPVDVLARTIIQDVVFEPNRAAFAHYAHVGGPTDEDLMLAVGASSLESMSSFAAAIGPGDFLYPLCESFRQGFLPGLPVGKYRSSRAKNLPRYGSAELAHWISRLEQYTKKPLPS